MGIRVEGGAGFKAGFSGLDPQRLVRMYETMLRIRVTEEKVADLVAAGEIATPCHLYVGQEAIAAGVCAALRKDDFVYSTHRSHGHYLAKGGGLKEMMAELYGKAAGCAGGHGGSMHLVAPEVGFPGSSSIVGGTIPLAVGTALSFFVRGVDSVAVAFFGDGAATEGVFYESLNFAALKRLPVIFVCENNFYSTHMHINAIQSSEDIYRRALAFDMPAFKIDGNSVSEVWKSASEAVERARSGKGPTLIECVTYRWRGHVGPNWDIDKGLRSKDEVDSWVARCAIKALRDELVGCGAMTDEEAEQMRSNAVQEVEDAVEFAKKSAFPDASDYLSKVFKESGAGRKGA